MFLCLAYKPPASYELMRFFQFSRTLVTLHDVKSTFPPSIFFYTFDILLRGYQKGICLIWEYFWLNIIGSRARSRSRTSRQEVNDVQSDARLLCDSLREWFWYHMIACFIHLRVISPHFEVVYRKVVGTNLTPTFKWIWLLYVRVDSPMHMFSPLLVSTGCLKMWIGLWLPLFVKD